MLALLVDRSVAAEDVELWSLPLRSPVRACLQAAAESPRLDWPVARSDSEDSPRELHCQANLGRSRDLCLTNQFQPAARGGEVAALRHVFANYKVLAISPSEDLRRLLL